MRSTKFPRELRDLAFVPRWQIIRQIKQQSVAEHSYFVTVYADRIAEMIKWSGDRAALVRYALSHDWDESFMGDIPGPGKAAYIDRAKMKEYSSIGTQLRFGPMEEPSDDIRYITKCADMLDELLYLCGERQLGNNSLEHVYTYTWDRFLDAVKNLPASDEDKRALNEEVYMAVRAEKNLSSQEIVRGVALKD